MKKLVEESPNLKQIFLSRLTKAALTRFSTWLISVINSLDCKVDEQDFVYAVPVLFVDIPFELFRAYMRTMPDVAEIIQVVNSSEIRVGCIANTTLQKSLATFVAKHFFDEKIANPDLKEMMIIRMNMFL